MFPVQVDSWSIYFLVFGSCYNYLSLAVGDENGEVAAGEGGATDAAKSSRQFESDPTGARSSGHDGVATPNGVVRRTGV